MEAGVLPVGGGEHTVGHVLDPVRVTLTAPTPSLQKDSVLESSLSKAHVCMGRNETTSAKTQQAQRDPYITSTAYL